MSEREFLVFYEDDQPEEELVLDIHTVRSAFASQLDIEADMGLNVRNVAGRTGRIGITLSTIGLACGLLAALLFSLRYPAEWTTTGSSATMVVNVFAVLGMIGLISGTVLTIVGRKIEAEGLLHGIHLVERRPSRPKGESWDAATDDDTWDVAETTDAEEDSWDFGSVDEGVADETAEQDPFVEDEEDDPFADDDTDDPFADEDTR